MKSSDSASIDLKANPKNLKIELRRFIRRLSDERSMFRNSSDHLFWHRYLPSLLGTAAPAPNYGNGTAAIMVYEAR